MGFQVFLKDDRKPLLRFWDGFKTSFLIAFSIALGLLFFSVYYVGSDVTVTAMLTPVIFAVPMGIYFGVVRVLRINLGNRTVGRFIIIAAALIWPLLIIGFAAVIN
jgi:hypothetical protein